jgi:hypothetical protein
MPRKVTRKELLKGGVAGAAAVAALPFASSIAFASEEGGHVAVHIHGHLDAQPTTPPAPIPSADVNVDAAGRPDALSGAGWDNRDADSRDVSTACYFAQRGTLEGHIIKLHGTNLLANNPAVRGFRVKTTANLETGDITWFFGPFIFAGKGVVTKID